MGESSMNSSTLRRSNTGTSAVASPISQRTSRESVNDKISQAPMSRAYRMEMYRKILGAEDDDTRLCSTLCDRSSETGFWVDSNQFKVMICFVVIANAAYVGVTVMSEEDDEAQPTSSLALLVCELFFLTAFSVELALRLSARGIRDFFKDGWSYFDLTLVLANALEVIAAFIHVANVGGLTTATAVLRVTRVMRLMRVFQIVRLFRFVDELHLLLKGMVSALRTLIWAMGMLFTVIYICSLVVTKYLGQNSQDETTKYYFGSLGRSMFTLFSFVTIEGWPDVARHLMDNEEFGGILVIIVICYILFTNLALLNLVTAVLVDSVVNISNSDDKKRMERFYRQRKETIRRLEQVFSRIDEDGNGELSFEEFEAGVRNSKEVRDMMQSLEIAVEDAKELFHLIDFDDNGKVSTMEFIEGAIMCKAGDAVSRHLLSFHYDVRKYFTLLGEAQQSLSDLISKQFDISPPQSSTVGLPKPRISSFFSRQGSHTSLNPMVSQGPTTPPQVAQQDRLLSFHDDLFPSEEKSEETPPVTPGGTGRLDTRSETASGELKCNFRRRQQGFCRLPTGNKARRRTRSGEQVSDEGLAGMESRLTELFRALEEKVSMSIEGTERRAVTRQQNQQEQQNQQQQQSGVALSSPVAAPAEANLTHSNLAEAQGSMVGVHTLFNAKEQQPASSSTPKQQISSTSSPKAGLIGHMPIAEVIPERSTDEMRAYMQSYCHEDSSHTEKPNDDSRPISPSVEWRSEYRCESGLGEAKSDFHRSQQSFWRQRVSTVERVQRDTPGAEQSATSYEGLAGMEARLTELLRALEEKVAISMEGVAQRFMGARQQQHSGGALSSPATCSTETGPAYSGLGHAAVSSSPESVGAKLPQALDDKPMPLPGWVPQPDDWQVGQTDQAPVQQQGPRSQRPPQAVSGESADWFPILRT